MSVHVFTDDTVYTLGRRGGAELGRRGRGPGQAAVVRASASGTCLRRRGDRGRHGFLRASGERLRRCGCASARECRVGAPHAAVAGYHWCSNHDGCLQQATRIFRTQDQRRISDCEAYTLRSPEHCPTRPRTLEHRPSIADIPCDTPGHRPTSPDIARLARHPRNIARHCPSIPGTSPNIPEHRLNIPGRGRGA